MGLEARQGTWTWTRGAELPPAMGSPCPDPSPVSQGKYMDVEFDFKGEPLGGVISNCEYRSPILGGSHLTHAGDADPCLQTCWRNPASSGT